MMQSITFIQQKYFYVHVLVMVTLLNCDQEEQHITKISENGLVFG